MIGVTSFSYRLITIIMHRSQYVTLIIYCEIFCVLRLIVYVIICFMALSLHNESCNEKHANQTATISMHPNYSASKCKKKKKCQNRRKRDERKT